MAKIKILIEGRVKKTENGWLASPSTVLIKDGEVNILVDPGSDKELLVKKLAEENLQCADIDIVFLTHHHLDHTLNLRLFPDCDILLDTDMMNGADEIFTYSDKIPKTNIKIIPTPGHTIDHESLLVQTDRGKICVAGDLFWWLENEEQKTDYESLISRQDPNGAKDELVLKESRKLVLELADWVIPGHGPMFRSPK